MKNIWLETDLEPDDILAIYLLIKKQLIPKYIVVGESDVKDKMEIMCHLITFLKTERILSKDHMVHIIYGHGSSTIHPYLLSDKKQTTPHMQHSNYTHYNYMLSTYINDNNDPIFIGLKPPRELIDYTSSLDNQKMLKKLTAYFYGSFNFRSIPNKIHLFQILPLFKETYIYESYYATGLNNSMTPENCPLTWKTLFIKESKYLKQLFYAITTWNEYQLIQCRNKCTTLLQNTKLSLPFCENKSPNDIIQILKNNGMNELDIPNFIRLHKIYINILKDLNNQIVLADMALVTIIDDPIYKHYGIKGDISFDKFNYTVFTPNESSNIYLYQKISIDQLDKSMDLLLNLEINSF